MQRMRWFCLGLISSLVFTVQVFAFQLPESIKQLAEEKGKKDFVKIFESIPILSPDEFIAEIFSKKNLVVVGAGFNGIVFKDENNKTYKFSYGIFRYQGTVTTRDDLGDKKVINDKTIASNWNKLVNFYKNTSLHIDKVRKTDEAALIMPISYELYGTLLWAIYADELDGIPGMISQDSLAFQGNYIDGINFAKLIESERLGTDLHKKYNMKKVWEQFVHYQKIAQKMFLDIGVSADMVVPHNFIVEGEKDNIKLRYFDKSFIVPSEATKKYYASQNVTVKNPAFLNEIEYTPWPLHYIHNVIASKNFDVSFEQAYRFVAIHLGTNDKTKILKEIANTPKLIIEIAPQQTDFSHIEKAQRILDGLETFPENCNDFLNK